MDTSDHSDAIQALRAAAAELADIHRARDYGFWRQDNATRLTEALARAKPFSDTPWVWMFTGDGGGCSTRVAFGEWAIDMLVGQHSPESIVAAYLDEVQRNEATYTEVSPVYGVQVDERCELEDGVTLVPTPGPEILFQRLAHYAMFEPIQLATDTSLLLQTFTVRPAFEVGECKEALKSDVSNTTPPINIRDNIRKRARSACLLASSGPVELPDKVLRTKREELFVGGNGNAASQPFSRRQISPFPVEANKIKSYFDLLPKFLGLESLSRAIDRLGRSRLAASQVDHALDLGVAAEIALMHDNSADNTEISHKIGSRAAWLLGNAPDERESIYHDMRKLYGARSQAVHRGALSSSPSLDLNAADRLVTRILSAILERGKFPNWTNLTMGGPGI